MLKNRVCVWISLPGGDRDPFQWVTQTRTHTNPSSASIKYQALFTYSTPQTSHCQQSEGKFSTLAAERNKSSVVQQQWSWLLDTLTVGHDITDQNSDKLGIFRRGLMICKRGKYSIDFLVNFVLFLWIWHLGQEPASEQYQWISGKYFLYFKCVWKRRSRQLFSLESKNFR